MLHNYFNMRTPKPITRFLALVIALALIAAGFSSDFNGDGFSDLVVGISVSRTANVIRPGAIVVLYGTATGLKNVLSCIVTSRMGGGMAACHPPSWVGRQTTRLLRQGSMASSCAGSLHCCQVLGTPKRADQSAASPVRHGRTIRTRCSTRRRSSRCIGPGSGLRCRSDWVW